MSAIAPEYDRPDPVAALLDAVIVVGRNGSIVDANPVAGRMFGYSRTELLGLSVEALIPSNLRAAHAAQSEAPGALPWPRKTR